MGADEGDLLVLGLVKLISISTPDYPAGGAAAARPCAFLPKRVTDEAANVARAAVAIPTMTITPPSGPSGKISRLQVR